MHQDYIVLVDLLYLASNPVPLLVDHLYISHECGLLIAAMMEMFFEFRLVVVGHGLIVEGKWVLIGPVLEDDSVKVVTANAVVAVLLVVVLLRSYVLFVFLEEEIT